MLRDFVGSMVSRAVHGTPPVLHLFGGPYVSVGTQQVDIPEASNRLLAFVALHNGSVSRRHVAGVLWPDCDDGRASANLRSALWRLNGLGWAFVEACRNTLVTGPDVIVDVAVVNDWATRLISHREVPDDLLSTPQDVNALELLPDLSDEWALIERERMRQRLLHAFESQSRQLLIEGRYGEAIEVALAVVCADPLRESAQRVLIECHLAEENRVEADRAYRTYQSLLRREVGAEPSAALTRLIRPLRLDPVQSRVERYAVPRGLSS
jgi:DNA-binding SARP family transcriptional activator